MAKFAEDDRLEQMNEQKRRMKVEAHKREAQRTIDLRRQMYEQTRQAEREEGAHLRAEEDERQLVIQEERQRLLREHAGDLRDFLPKGTFAKKQEFDIVFGDKTAGVA